MLNKLNAAKEKFISLGGRITATLKDESGFGVKEIAITVAVIVLIGVIVTFVTGQLTGSWIDQLWNMFIDNIEKYTQ